MQQYCTDAFGDWRILVRPELACDTRWATLNSRFTRVPNIFEHLNLLLTLNFNNWRWTELVLTLDSWNTQTSSSYHIHSYHFIHSFQFLHCFNFKFHSHSYCLQTIELHSSFTWTCFLLAIGRKLGLFTNAWTRDSASSCRRKPQNERNLNSQIPYSSSSLNFIWISESVAHYH